MSHSNFDTPLSNTNAAVKVKKFNCPVIQTGSISRMDFVSTPLEPTWIVNGNPAARSVSLARAEDQNLSCGLWDCQAGKFKFIFACDEIVHILEGEVTIEENGATYTLRTGDVAFFPEGLETYWTVPKYVKKFAIFRSVQESLPNKIYSKLKKLIKKMIGKR